VPDGTPCDDGDICTIDDECQNAVCDGFEPCGDGIVQDVCGEECDTVDADTVSCDGNPVAANGNACTFASCGDGYANGAAGEECDDEDLSTCPAGQVCSGCVCVPAPELSLAAICGGVVGGQGLIVTLPVSLMKSGNPVASVSFSLDFPVDHLVTPPLDVACSDAASDFSCSSSPAAPGVLEVLVTPPIQAPPIPELPDGEIVEITFRVHPNADGGAAAMCTDPPEECIPIVFSDAEFGDTSGRNITGGLVLDGCICASSMLFPR
jgi:hypothetical protein